MRKQTIIYVLFVFMAYFSLNAAKANRDLFYKHIEIINRIPISHIGNIRSVRIDEMENIWILSSKTFTINKFNNKGELQLTFGRKGQGPGEFAAPFDFAIFQSHLYVTDVIQKKIHIFSDNGKYIRSFKIRDGRKIHVVDKHTILLAAPWSDNGKDFFCIHQYVDEKLTNSFFPLSNIVKENKLIYDSVFFDMDENKNIYCIQGMDYNVFKYNSSNVLIKNFATKNDYYISPPSTPFSDFYSRPKLSNWIKSWTHISDIMVFRNLILVNLNDSASETYFIDIYGPEGEFQVGGLETKYRLINANSNGFLYFIDDSLIQSTGDGDYNILKCAIKCKKLN